MPKDINMYITDPYDDEKGDSCEVDTQRYTAIVDSDTAADYSAQASEHGATVTEFDAEDDRRAIVYVVDND